MTKWKSTVRVKFSTEEELCPAGMEKYKTFGSDINLIETEVGFYPYLPSTNIKN